jgi:hypothetical protein
MLLCGERKRVVVQFAKSLTTKGTKVHQGKHLGPKAFVILRALGVFGVSLATSRSCTNAHKKPERIKDKDDDDER